jgi:hypothetical protein
VTRFDASAALAPLAGFQRATVDHVMRRLYDDPQPTRRFLVADETGLGKSLVARGVVARTVERLQDDQTIRRIDVVYVCSNADIARQNVKRLDVIGQHQEIASRLTLLARGASRLDGEPVAGDKAVNLVSFTPGTLPGDSRKTGAIAERALIHVLLRDYFEFDKPNDKASMLLLQGGVSKLETVAGWARWTREEASRHGGVEPTIAQGFIETARADGVLNDYLEYVELSRGKYSRLPPEIVEYVPSMIGRLRTALAHASVEALEPDLVILDEFQRFRELIDPDAKTEAADLARSLFSHRDARVLLLSATPIKAFTFAEEAANGDDHQRDLTSLLTFLTEGSRLDPATISADLAEYRKRAIAGAPVAEVRERVQTALTSVMSRTERPRVGAHGQLDEDDDPVGPVEPEELRNWVALHDLADAVRAGTNSPVPMTLEYWKSAPYFANFLDGYKFGELLRDQLRGGNATDDVRQAVDRLTVLDPAAVAAREPIDLGNARLKALRDKTIGKSLHNLLWVPPSLPYEAPAGPYESTDPANCSKLLLFSSWSATPTAVASLLSYEADLEIGGHSTDLTRLDYRVDGGRPGAMTTLTLFWPNPRLAELCDPIRLARETVDGEEMIRRAVNAISASMPTGRTSRASTAEAAYWQVALGAFGAPPIDGPSAATEALSGHAGSLQSEPSDTDDAPTRLRAHVDLALSAIRNLTVEEAPEDLATTVADIALHAPGNIAWRVLGRLLVPGHTVSPEGRWVAAATLASGFRTLFNRAEAVGILDAHTPKEEAYWRAVLTYCSWGNLEAVLDEHLYHLAGVELGDGPPSDDDLLQLALALRSALTLRPSIYTAFNPHDPQHRIPFTSRFALRYGTARHADEDSRLPEIRNAFNSPFWPWVLATTSVGQEGIDFHWWCHSIVHWNTPPNPVDFEQREGRVNRFGGLAVRRNLAHRHGAAVLASSQLNPWALAYEFGLDERDRLGELAPQWVYPGPTSIRRTVLPYPLSTDLAKYRRIKDDLALYRLTFGQPRQEDLLELLKQRGVQDDPERMAELRLNLSPPRSGLTDIGV